MAKRVKQAGAIVFRSDGAQRRILLVRSRRSPHDWIFPKGRVEIYESSADAALREAEEEAGVSGDIITPVCPPLDFSSNGKPVRVQYYLVVMTGERPALEEREKCWVEPAAALEMIAHEDARALLKQALADARRWPADAMMVSQHTAATAVQNREGDPLMQLLLAEYAHTGESLLRNEEDGEKRVTFFVTLAAAVISALAFVVGDEGALKGDSVGVQKFAGIATIPLILLIALGYLTFMRVVTRNVASDRYKEGMNRIRRWFVKSLGRSATAFLAFDPLSPTCRNRASLVPFRRGGWLETIAVMESLLIGALTGAALIASAWKPSEFVLTATVVATVGAWVFLNLDANRRYRNQRDSSRE